MFSLKKPLCLHCGEVQTIQEFCKENGVHVLEGVMVAHHPWQKAVKDIIDQKKYGVLKNIHTRIAFNVNKDDINYRFFPEYGGGCFL